MSDLFAEPSDATPLSPAERQGLLQSWITHRRDLNEAEQENILKGAAWARRRRRASAGALLNADHARTLHKRMFGDVWGWAGAFSQAERNIGVEPHPIPEEVEVMFADVRYWVRHGTYPRDEIAVRLHHRLVAIHPFPNGNGRHARLMADILVELLGGEPFTWGGGNLVDDGKLRAAYMSALRAADGRDIEALVAFARL